MILQMSVGGVVVFANIVVHAVAMLLTFRLVKPRIANSIGLRPILYLSTVMVLTIMLLMGAHIIEIGLWGVAFVLLHAVEPPDAAFYFAFVSYTTLGYGDVLASSAWRLLGPIAAMNGILLSGWSTAVIMHMMSEVARRHRETSGAG